MKLTVLLLTAAMMHVYGKGFSQTITFSGKDVPLPKVFAAFEKQTGYVFFYNNRDLVNTSPVTLTLKNVPLEAALNECLKNHPLQYVIKEKTIFIKAKSPVSVTLQPAGNNEASPPLPPINLKGRVINEKGEPVDGVTVSIKGTSRTTYTNLNGEFSIEGIAPDAILVFTSVNMEAFELEVNSKTALSIKLKTKIAALGEVSVTINTGYQQISKERFVGSVATLDSASFQRRAGMNIIDRLDGTLTGILFDKKGSADILDNIQIRGISTLGGTNNTPLVIVDNFPFKQSLDMLNPNDVESITLLKDAAATSIWGAQAGNGVIVITTKKGKYNQPVRFSASSNITIRQKPDLYYYPQIAPSDIVDIESFLFDKGRYDIDLSNTSTWPVISPVVEILAKKRAGQLSAADAATQIDALKQLDVRRDLNKYVYRPSVLQQHYINLNGGTNLFNYNFSAGYNHSLNNIRHSRPDDQFTINSNAGFRPVKNLEITTAINCSQSIRKSTGFAEAAIRSPYAQLADADGNPLAVAYARRLAYTDTAGGGKLLDWRYRPLEEVALADAKTINRFTALNISIAYRFTSWLNASATYQYNSDVSGSSDFHSIRTYLTRNLINRFTNLSQTNPDLRNPVPLGGILDLSHSESVSQNVRGQLNLNKTFGSDHLLTAMVAAEVSETKSTGEANRLYGYDKQFGTYKSTIDYLSYFPMYGGLSGNEQVENESRTLPIQTNRFVSFLGNMSYTYRNRYSLYASARKDGSNFFGINTNRKWTPLWSSGISWDIAKENFYKPGWINALRVRASYGYSGNPGNATGMPTMRYNAGTDQFTGQVGGQLNNPPNPNLRWEKVRIINAALDFGLFHNRLSGSIDIYQKRVMDLISEVPIAPSTGVLNVTTNVADLKGNGFEINLTSKNIDGVFNWQTNFGLSHARMLVAKLGYEESTSYRKALEFVTYALNAAEGKIVYGLASYRWAGLDPATGNPRGYLGKQVSTNYNAIFNDTIGNQVFHGSAIPLYSGFVSNTFGWKRFSLSANITYRLSFYFRKPAINYGGLVQKLSGDAAYYRRWQQPGDERFTNVPSFSYPANSDRDDFYQYSAINVLRGDNIRLQDLRLQYTWDNRNTPKIPVKKMSAFLYANNLNLILWRKNEYNLDPDFTGGGGQAVLTPTPISWTAGINLSF